MEGVGVKVSRNAQSSDLVIEQNFAYSLQKFAEGVPNHCDTAFATTNPPMLAYSKAKPARYADTTMHSMRRAHDLRD